MPLKNRKLVTHVDVDTYELFNKLAQERGDTSSALLRKIVAEAVKGFRNEESRAPDGASKA